MPFARPDLDTLVAQTLADIQGALAGSDPLLTQAVLNIVGVSFAEAFNSTYGYLDWISLQAVPYTATDEHFAAWAGLKGQTQVPASAATASWSFAAASNGLTVAAGAQVTRSDGVAYASTADAVSAGGVVVLTTRCVTAGAAGTVNDGVSGVLSAPVAGVASAGVGTSIAAGADLEPFDAFKTRVLQIFAAPPQGGAFTDYVEWAEQVPGVTRAWCAPLGQGAGTVVVYFMMDVSRAVDGGFPQGTNGVAAGETRDAAATGDQLLVADYIFGPDRQPVPALVYACAPSKNTVTHTIKLTGASTALKAAIEAAIASVYQRKGSVGGVRLDDGSAGGVVDLSDIEAAIAAVPGSAGFVITVVSCDHGSVSPGSNGNVTAAVGYLSVPGPSTWS